MVHVIPTNDRPSGYATDKDGICKPNVPKKNCCDYSLPIPNNPKDMLPVTSLYSVSEGFVQFNRDNVGAYEQ